LIEAENSEPELASLSSSNPDTPEAKQNTRSAARRRAKAAEPESTPEVFEQWWRGYYDFCLKVDCSPGDRATAATTWDVLHAIESDCTPRILEGAQWYCAVKLREFAAKGQAVGVPHGCRFLSKRKWQEALDHKTFKPDFLSRRTDPETEEEVSKKRMARLREIQQEMEAKNAERQAV
jgi:hypothetical protein